MKILLFSPSFGAYGGIEAFVMRLAKHLAATPGVELRVRFKLQPGSPSEPLRALFAKEGLDASCLGKWSPALARELGWPDLIHTQNVPPVVTLASIFLGKPFVSTLHNRFLGASGPRGWLWRLGLRKASRVWFNSAFVMRSWGVDPNDRRLSVVPTVCDLDFTTQPPPTRRGFICVSRLIEGKGASNLLQAYKLAGLDSAATPLAIVGDGPIRPSLEAERDRLGLGHVQLPGFVSEAAKRSMIRGSRWLVTVPDVPEDMGLTPLEARAMGVPCLVSTEGGLPEVGGEEGLKSPPRDPVALAGQLRAAAMMDEAEYADRARRCLPGVQAIARPLDFYPNAYREVLGLGPPP